jgi:predicted metalloendopeptidase
MIIGNNSNKNNFTKQNTFTTNFNERFNTIQEENKKNKNKINPFQEKITTYNNISNKNDMTNKSFAMLQERYNKGLISLDEFNKKCNKLRQK